jgi:arylsulfatase
MRFPRPLLAALALAAACLAAAPARAADRLPNVVVIFTDDQGYGDLGSFGAKGYTTPHIDSLARDGVKFTNFHVAQAVCSASRAALLTGCYPNRLGIHGALGPNSNHGIHAAETTLAEVFKSRGYATGMAGKWHLGHREPFIPNRHGFDESFGLPYSNDMWPHHPEAKPGTYPKLPLWEDGRVIDDEVSPEDQTQLTTRYTDRAVRFIEKNKDRPFFFYLAHSMPHVPLFVSDKFKGKSQAGLFGDVLMEIDWSVGQVLETLRKHGLERDTLVIYTSDNGPWLSYGHHAGNAGPLREGKGTAWEGGTRVPALMRWPARLPAGTVCPDFLMTIDLLPTLAARIGAPLGDRPIDGRDVWPLLARTPGAKNPHEGYGLWYAQNELQAVVSGDGRWKMIFPHRYRSLAGKPGGRDGLPEKYTQVDLAAPALYDLQNDIGETTDVAAAHPAVVAKLQAFAEKCRADLGDNLQKRATGAGTREPGRVAAPEGDAASAKKKKKA